MDSLPSRPVSVAAATALAAGLTSDSRAADIPTVAIIGAGERGRMRAAQVSKAGGVVAAFCDPDPAALKATEGDARALGWQPNTMADFRKVLADKAIKAVVIATPTHWTALAGLWALAAGKDVLLEAPACYSFEEGQKLIAAAARSKAVVAVAHDQRSDAAHREAVGLARAGQVGELYTVRAVYLQPRPGVKAVPDAAPPAGLNWELWQGPAPRHAYNPGLAAGGWRYTSAYGLGELGAGAIDSLDTARWLLGDGELPTAIFGSASRWGDDVPGDTPNVLQATYTLADGRSLVVVIRGLVSPDEDGNRNGVIALGATGWMNESDGFKPHLGYKGDGKPPADLKPAALSGAAATDSVANFLDVVKSRQAADLNCPLVSGVRTAQTAILAQISAKLGRALKFDPAKGQFVDDPAANALLKRPAYAPGFALPTA